MKLQAWLSDTTNLQHPSAHVQSGGVSDLCRRQHRIKHTLCNHQHVLLKGHTCSWLQEVATRRAYLWCALQTVANQHDLQGALSTLFRESREALMADVSPTQFHNLEQRMVELEGIFALLEQQPYAGSPAVR